MSRTARCCGAQVVTATGERSTIRARKTLLAVNGFAGNPELVRRFCPEIAGATYFGALGSTGEAVLWGEALGAALVQYRRLSGLCRRRRSARQPAVVDDDREGRDHRRRVGAALWRRERGLFRLHARCHGGSRAALRDLRPEDFRRGRAGRGVRGAREVRRLQVGGLAWRTGRSDRTRCHRARATLAEARAAAQGETADPFGRRDFGLGALSGTLYACRVVPGLFHTQGGLAVDLDGRVLDQQGRAIPNLFAGGGATGGLSGRSGGAGYASGNGLLSALALGRLAGSAAAREVLGARTGVRPGQSFVQDRSFAPIHSPCDAGAAVAGSAASKRASFRRRSCCRSSVVEHSLGKGEVVSSILTGSTSSCFENQPAVPALPPEAARTLRLRNGNNSASNQGCFLIQALLRQEGCGSGIRSGVPGRAAIARQPATVSVRLGLRGVSQMPALGIKADQQHELDVRQMLEDLCPPVRRAFSSRRLVAALWSRGPESKIPSARWRCGCRRRIHLT